MTQEQLIGLLIVLWGAYALWAGLIGWRRALRGRLIRSLVRLIGPVGTLVDRPSVIVVSPVFSLNGW